MNPAGPTGAAINALGADPGTEATFAEPGSYGSNEAGDDTYSTGVDGDAPGNEKASLTGAPTAYFNASTSAADSTAAQAAPY